MSDCCGQPVPPNPLDYAEQLKALGPKSVTIGGETFSMHSVQDVIAWQKHQAIMQAARNPLGTLGNLVFTPSGHCRGSSGAAYRRH